LLPRRAYGSAQDFVSVLSEAFRHVERKIKDTNSIKIYWEQSAKGPLVPRPEPQVMTNIAALLEDHSLVAGYQLIRESAAGSGRVDLRAIAPLANGGTLTVCIEGKHAHVDSVEHGIVAQLPEYMRRTGADFGIYLVLWFQSADFNRPKDSALDLRLALHGSRPWNNILVEILDLSLPLPPSHPAFEFR